MRIILFSLFLIYTILIFVVAWLTSRNASNNTYFTGNRKSPWFVVAYGMIGASLSGVTFMSVPGDVATTQFTYFCLVIGYVLGYLAIAYVLLPLYYKLNLTSIYEYLGTRMGGEAHKTSSVFFIISRLMGSALRMYLVIYVLQIFIFDEWNIPLWLTALVMIIIILLYTFRSGIKTVVWMDTLQTTFLLTALVITIVIIFRDLNMTFPETWNTMQQAGHTKIFETDWRMGNFYLKHIIGGMFITITMTGMDQDMMQKNLTCKNLKDAQRNMLSFTGILVFVNMLFLFLGGLLLVYASQNGINLQGMPTDRIYPEITFNYLGVFASIAFVVGLVAAGYSSADGTLTALTTSICFDIIKIDNLQISEQQKVRLRRIIHVAVATVFLLIIIVFSRFHNKALITIIFTVASYTYGPILGLFAFGMFTKRKVRWPALVPVLAIVSPVLCFVLSKYSQMLFNGYKFGFELLIVNGLITFLLLMMISKNGEMREERGEMREEN